MAEANGELTTGNLQLITGISGSAMKLLIA
jgi:hypothetical protein